MAIMQGDLRDYALRDLLQFLQTLRRKGQLLIERQDPQQSCGVYFSSGRVVHAYCPPDEGEQAIYRLLQWRSGRFIFLADASPERETIHSDLRTLLLEGMRLIDELPDVRQHLPPADTVLYLERDSEKIATLRINARQWRLLSTINGSRTVGDVLSFSGRDLNEVSRDLYHLLIVGLVSEQRQIGFLADIIPEKNQLFDTGTTPSPLPIISTRIVMLADGNRSLLEIGETLHCSDQDLIEEFRFLVRSGHLRILSGQDTFMRYLV